MKTSNKLLLTALTAMIISIAWYDAGILGIYRSGAYKKARVEYKSLAFKDFDVLDINASSQANVRVTQGPFSVKLSITGGQNFTNIKQQGKHLQINVNMTERSYDPTAYVVLVSCPILKAVNADDKYTVHQKFVTDTSAAEDSWSRRKTLISGFKLDSLSIRQSNGSYLIMAGNQIGNLNAIIGSANNSASYLDISKNNNLKRASVNVLNKSTMMIDNRLLQSVKYEIADSAKLVITGAARK